MASDGKVVFQIDGDARGVKTTIKDVTNDIEKESKKWDNAVKESSDDMTKSFAKAFDIERVKNWGIQAAKAIVKFIGDSISAASDLAEVQNVVDVTFGESSKKIDAWAQAAGNNFGLTETQAKRYASTIGAMIKSQGIAQKDVLDMSESLAGLAADMASFYNLDFDTAFEKIRSGISGETMPLKQLGINMSVANMEAFALEQGITKSYSAMSQGEQTMLRYQYLMKATADAQGDFARTSDGFANATRKIASSIENIKAKAGGLLMQVVEPLVSGFSSFLDALTARPPRTILDDLADIDSDLLDKARNLEKTYRSAKAIVDVLGDLSNKTATLNNGQTITFEKLFGDLKNVQAGGGDIKQYIAGLGLDVDYISREYAVWNESVKQLTSTVPALTSAIDAQTGAIDGGTAAIQSNLDEWKAAEEKKLRLAAYYSRKRAIEEKRGELYVYEFDAESKRAYANQLNDELMQISDIANTAVNGKVVPFFAKAALDRAIDANPMLERFFKDLKVSVDDYWKAETDALAAEKEYTRQTEALGVADELLAAGLEHLKQLYPDLADEIENAGDAIESTADSSTQAAQTVMTAAQTALKALADYVQGVHDATENAVNGIIKGFEKIERPTQDLFEKRSKLIEQQNELNRSTKDGEKKYQELQKQIDDLNKSMEQYSPKGMKDALESQIAFMEEYISNLAKAREMGLSDELLASLSDGSVQSAEYLSGLVSDEAGAKEVDRLFGIVREYKESLTDALTDQKLAFDTTYDGLVETAQNAIGAMDLEDEARRSMERTMNGLIQGISAHAGELEEWVATIQSILSRMTNVSGAVSFGVTDGSILDGSHETGLDYVPFDNYLASLHEGEGILTAEENRIWQRFKNGASPQTMDYDALGATMRENVQAGGNVYLDGKTVGRVISDQQGNAYRQLQRSGWQK